MQHLAHMVAPLRPPTLELLKRSDVAAKYFNTDRESHFLHPKDEALIWYRLFER
jgi:hypothetical protein